MIEEKRPSPIQQQNYWEDRRRLALGLEKKFEEIVKFDNTARKDGKRPLNKYLLPNFDECLFLTERAFAVANTPRPTDPKLDIDIRQLAGRLKKRLEEKKLQVANGSAFDVGWDRHVDAVRQIIEYCRPWGSRDPVEFLNEGIDKVVERMKQRVGQRRHIRGFPDNLLTPKFTKPQRSEIIEYLLEDVGAAMSGNTIDDRLDKRRPLPASGYRRRGR